MVLINVIIISLANILIFLKPNPLGAALPNGLNFYLRFTFQDLPHRLGRR